MAVKVGDFHVAPREKERSHGILERGSPVLCGERCAHPPGGSASECILLDGSSSPVCLACIWHGEVSGARSCHLAHREKKCRVNRPGRPAMTAWFLLLLAGEPSLSGNRQGPDPV
jgi:hypothetical protein